MPVQPNFTIKIYAEERVKDGLRVTRYTAEQMVGEKHMCVEGYDSPEGAVASLAIYASKRGGFYTHDF
jgi:hypothetical protein